jgi:heme/copper-type cytochrome/quinol oxidase subunit 2
MKAQIEVVSQVEFDMWHKEKVAAATNASTGNPPAQSK